MSAQIIPMMRFKTGWLMLVLGLTLRLGQDLGVGYRFQHMSNGGIDKPNPGLDLHAFALNYHF